MAGASSSSRSSGTAPLDTVKAEPLETLERRRSRGGGLVINEGRRQPFPSPDDHLRLVRPKKEPATPPVVVKQEHLAMAAADETDMK